MTTAKISLLIVDSSDQKDVIANAFNPELFSVLAVVDNGLDALRLCRELKPQALITDILLAGCDGYRVISDARRMLPELKILVISGLNQDSFVQRAFQLGADYYMLKPVYPEGLQERILDLIAPVTPIEPYRSTNKLLDERISNIFISVGIPAHIKGYQFLREAIKLSMSNPEAISKITKCLYPSIAERFNTTPSKVERAIRHAIEVAWNRGKIENINTIFGVKVYSGSDKPTNGEFIALVADKMLIESA